MKFKAIFKRNLSVLLACLFCLCSFSVGSLVSANASETVDPVIDLGDSFIRFTGGSLIRNQTYYSPDFGVVNSDNNSITLTYKVSSATTYAVEAYASIDFYGHNYGTLTISLELSSGSAFENGGYILIDGKPISNYSFTASGNKFTFIITGNIPRTFEIGAVYFNATPELVNSNNYLVTLYSNASFVPDYSNMSEDIISNQNQNTQDIIDNQKEQTNKISGFISNLGDRIGGFFTELKDNLINGIKNLFVPSEEALQTFDENMDALLSDHLGVLYQAPNYIVEFIEYIAVFSPMLDAEPSEYYIEVPCFSIFVNADPPEGQAIISTSDNGGTNIVLLPDNEAQDGDYCFRFSFLEEQPYSTLYGIYRVFVTFVVIVMFCLYCLRNYEKFLS